MCLGSSDSVQNDFCDTSSEDNFNRSAFFSIPVIQLSVMGLLVLGLIYLIFKRAVYITNQFLTVSVQLVKRSHQGDTPENVTYRNLLKWLGENVKNFQIEELKVHTSIIKPDEDVAKELTKLFPENQAEKEDKGSCSSLNSLVFAKDEECKTEYKLGHTSGFGTNFFQYKGKWIKLERKTHADHRMLILTVAWWDKSILYEIIDKIKPVEEEKDEEKLIIYTSQHGHWSQLGDSKKKRPLSSIILNPNLITTLKKDIKTFLSREDWYLERGIPYRRGYLLYGPPGCGKSSMIKAIAGEISYDICILSLSQKLNDDSINELLNQAPRKSVILIEDIDAAFKSREDENASSKETNLAFEGCSKSTLTFRGLLNALDGVGSAESGQLVFMTTNYPEKLDPALVRPGRVDLKLCIDYPVDYQIEGMFKKFYPDSDEQLKQKFVKEIRSLDVKITMAMLQGLMLMHMDDPDAAIENAKEHFQNQFSNVSNFGVRHF